MDRAIKHNPILAMILANMVLSLNSLMAKIGLETISPLLLVGLRYGVMAVILLTIAWFAREKVDAKDWPHIVVQSVLQLINAFSWFIGLEYTQAIDSSILFLLAPIMVYIGSVVFLSEPRSNKALMGSLVAMVGGLLMFGAPAIDGVNQDRMIGNGLLLLAVLSMAAAILHAKKVVNDRNLKTILGLRWLAVGAVGLMGSWVFEDPSSISDVSRSSIAALTFSIIISGVIGMLVFYKALEHMRAEDSASIFYIDPLTGVIAGSLILGETLSGGTLLAAGVIIGGVVISHPVHIQRTIYYQKVSHSKFEHFLRWVQKELDDFEKLIRRYI